MRAVVRYASFILGVITLVVVVVAGVGTWSHAYVRLEQNEKQINLLMSHRGHLRWFSYRLFDEPWEISKATPAEDSISVQLLCSGPRQVISSSATPQSADSFSTTSLSISSSVTMIAKPIPFLNNYFPQWKTETIGRQPVPLGFPDTPAEQMRSIQIPYWPVLALALASTVWSGRFVFNHLRSRRRIKTGRCPACAYDLRATTDRCPECGLVVARA